MPDMMRAVIAGGAPGLRLDGPFWVGAARKAWKDIPIVGCWKQPPEATTRIITPSVYHASELCRAGADAVAFDATSDRTGKEDIRTMIETIHRAKVEAWADVATLDEARYAIESGADWVAPTLAGRLDFDLITEMVKLAPGRVAAEGGIRYPEQAKRCLELGVTIVVVGAVITKPAVITKLFLEDVYGPSTPSG